MTDPPILSCRGVTKTFGGLRAVDEVTFDLRPGEVRGLVGPNGSGKSTLINLLSGHMTVDAGHIVVDGTRIEGLEGHRVAELGVARTYQLPRPFTTLDVLDNVRVGRYFGNRADRAGDIHADSLRWLEFVGLGAVARLDIGSLTLLQRKLLELARALACRPRVLFLDEVLTGLTPRELRAGVELVRRINELGISIVVVEHIMRVIRDLCEEVTVLNFGRVIASGRTEDCLGEPQVVDAYLGASNA